MKVKECWYFKTGRSLRMLLQHTEGRWKVPRPRSVRDLKYFYFLKYFYSLKYFYRSAGRAHQWVQEENLPRRYSEDASYRWPTRDEVKRQRGSLEVRATPEELKLEPVWWCWLWFVWPVLCQVRQWTGESEGSCRQLAGGHGLRRRNARCRGEKDSVVKMFICNFGKIQRQLLLEKKQSN